MYNWIYWLLGLMILSALIRIFKPKIKGWMGEKAVSAILDSLPQNEYRVINNVIVPTERGTSQIDHIVVSVYGIFVIETKNYKGWITGSDKSDQWTKNMYGKKYFFQNPIKQNYGHVKALENILRLPEDMFIPIVVFSINADLKVNTSHLVVYTVNLKKTIGKFKERKMDLAQVEILSKGISSMNIDSKGTRKSHVENVRQRVNDKERKITEGICPRCGGTLVEKKGRYGAFIGCSNYPKCRYTSQE